MSQGLASKLHRIVEMNGMKFTEKNTFLHFQESPDSPRLVRSASLPALIDQSSAPSLVSSQYIAQNDAMTCQRTEDRVVGHVPLSMPSCPQEEEEQFEAKETLEWCDNNDDLRTVMLKNLPCNIKDEEVIDAIEKAGFKDKYDFFYLPYRSSKKNSGCLGYAFVGFPDAEVTKMFVKAFTGYRLREKTSSKVISVVPAHIQGFEGNANHYRHTMVMRRGKHRPVFHQR